MYHAEIITYLTNDRRCNSFNPLHINGAMGILCNIVDLVFVPAVINTESITFGNCSTLSIYTWSSFLWCHRDCLNCLTVYKCLPVCLTDCLTVRKCLSLTDLYFFCFSGAFALHQSHQLLCFVIRVFVSSRQNIIHVIVPKKLMRIHL